MATRNGLYEVWISRGTGTTVGPRFRRLDDARRYVRDHHGEASFAIRTPDDRWEVEHRDVLVRTR
jgi:hypothetical protein